MWIRRYGMLWVTLQLKKSGHRNITFPVPLSILYELIESLIDILDFSRLFTGRGTKNPSMRAIALWDISHMLTNLLDELIAFEPYELLNVQVDHVQVVIKTGLM